MKKGVILILVVILCFNFVYADESSQVDSAFSCLEDYVSTTGCDSFSLEEKIFAYWSMGECGDSLTDSVLEEGCFSEDGSSCDLKLTALAVIALEELGENATEYISWISEQTDTSSYMEWYLQIDSDEVASCELETSRGTYSFQINSNDKLTSSDSSSCFSISDDYWIEIFPNCYEEKINITCNETFTSNLFFVSSSQINLFKTIKSSNADDTIQEEVAAYCFTDGSFCNYEQTLWSVVALDISGNETSLFIPYLIYDAEDNGGYLPESFLFYLTGESDFEDELISLQNSEGYWSVSGDDYFDTALALLFISDDSSRSLSESWLLSSQEDDGCWSENDSSFLDTAFILVSAWPEYTYSASLSDSDASDSGSDCENNGGYCMSSSACSKIYGNTLDYSCESSLTICCDTDTFSCSDAGGTYCDSAEVCSGTTYDDCCLDGECVEDDSSASATTCSNYGGTCKTSCSSDEEEYAYDCDSSTQVCCIEVSGEINLWIFVIIGVILLSALAFILIRFRDRIFKNKRGGNRPSPSRSPRPSMPPRSPPKYTQNYTQKKSYKGTQKNQDDSDVFKKLKEMGNS